VSECLPSPNAYPVRMLSWIELGLEAVAQPIPVLVTNFILLGFGDAQQNACHCSLRR
jgi:hypothetical protein